MSAYAYCATYTCGEPLPMASLREAITGRQECIRCHAVRHVGDGEKEDVLRSVDERLAVLTQAVLMLGAALSAEALARTRPTQEQWDVLAERLK